MSNNNFDPVPKIKNAPSRSERAFNKFVETIREEPEGAENPLHVFLKLLFVGLITAVLAANVISFFQKQGYEQGRRDAQTTIAR